jgi:hypothetical protein
MNNICVVIVLACIIATFSLVTIRNDIPRTDINGNIIDCHSGMILKHGSRYYMYGEYYGRSVGIGESNWPKLVVYTSPDMVNWVNRGYMIEGVYNGTMYTPWVVYNERLKLFVAWFNFYPNGCCYGNWGVATSTDGIVFTLNLDNVAGRFPGVDGSTLFVDDDGTGYIIYTCTMDDHYVSIEKLTPDYLYSTQENYGLFPDRYVEGAILFKRKGMYYVAYGSCCCFCRGGSGVVVFSSENIRGPWKRLGYDKNCRDPNVFVCGTYGDRSHNNLTINAQGIGLSVLQSKQGENIYLWHGERWLSAPNNNATCLDECRTCVEPASYIKGNGFSYWIPLQFDAFGDVLPFEPFVNSFTLDI